MIKKLSKTLLLLTAVAAFSLLFISCPTTDAAPQKSTTSQVIEIKYPSKDYSVPQNEMSSQDYFEKRALVYLPAGYNEKDTDTKYPLLILMHGNGGDEYSWGLSRSYGEIRIALDNGIASGEVKEFILVTPNGVSDKTWNSKWGYSNRAGVIEFGKELRNDLLPYLKENFNILEGRENVAMAGLSMGAEQTMEIGIGQCLDLIAYFGAFSCTPFTVGFNMDSGYLEPSEYIKQVESTFPDSSLKIKLLYMTCGTTDTTFYPGYNAYVPAMQEWNRIENFGNYTVQGAGHEWKVWTASFNEFIPLLFK